jgi:hypothetical protein
MDNLFSASPEAEAASRTMNCLFTRARDAKGWRPASDLSRPTEAPAGPAAPASAERLSQALSYLEACSRRGDGDPDQIAYAEHILDSAIEASRAARERPRDPETGQYLSDEQIAALTDFGGGSRQRTSFMPRGVAHPSANALFKQAIERSREQAAEREEETTIFVK